MWLLVFFFQESRERSLSSSVKLDENLSASLSNISALEKALAVAGEKYIFMQKLRDYISVICKFLQVRVYFVFPVLNIAVDIYPILGGLFSGRRVLHYFVT